jgi:hypothetical protein
MRTDLRRILSLPVILLGLGVAFSLSSCGDDEETLTETGNGEAEPLTAVVEVNGLEVLNLAAVRPTDPPTAIPVRLRSENTVVLRINSEEAEMANPENAYPCWGALRCPWTSATSEQHSYPRTFSSGALPDSVFMGRLVVTPNTGFLSFEIDYETGPTGPVFSGPQQVPFLCRTEEAGLGQPLADNGDEDGGTGIPVYREDPGGTKTDEVIGYSRDCSMITRLDYFYKSTADDRFHRLDITQALPEDLAETTTTDGLTVDYIVRLERGTVNRFIYGLAMLASPSELGGESWDLTAWNGKLVYQFQGGVGIGHEQGSGWAINMVKEGKDLDDGGPIYDDVLALGYAVAFSTGTVTDTHYNLLLSEETMMMVKDHFIERYGAPEYTVGVGGSGGSIQQYFIGQSQLLPSLRHHDPYLLDAGIPQYSYSDMITQSIYVGDCSLLEYYFDVVAPSQGDTAFGGMRVLELDLGALGTLRLPMGLLAPSGWLGSVLPRTWIEGMSASDTAGHPVWSSLGDFLGSTECINGWLGLTPLAMNPLWTTTDYSHLPPDVAAEFDAVKWTHWNDLENIYGTDENGYAPYTWDNVGVQYGLQALKDGNITIEQFLDINAKIGGWKDADDMVPESILFGGDLDLESIGGILELLFDFDPWSIRNANLQRNAYGVAPRREADIDAVHSAYTSGHVFVGKIDIPLIDARHYLDPVLDMHHSQQSFATRQRMLDGQGHADNQLIWFAERPYDNTVMAFELLDEWLTNIRNNPGVSVPENKPAAAVDKCFDADGNIIAEGPDVWDGILNDEPEGACTQAFPLYSTSRIVAGGNIKGDVFKCHLQTVDEAIAAGVYEGIPLREPDIARLKEIFPDGVCDYTQGDAARPAGW